MHYVCGKPTKWIYLLYYLLNCPLCHVVATCIVLKDELFSKLVFSRINVFVVYILVQLYQLLYIHTMLSFTHTHTHTLTTMTMTVICICMGLWPPQHNKIIQKIMWFAHSACIQQTLGGLYTLREYMFSWINSHKIVLVTTSAQIYTHIFVNIILMIKMEKKRKCYNLTIFFSCCFIFCTMKLCCEGSYNQCFFLVLFLLFKLCCYW